MKKWEYYFLFVTISPEGKWRMKYGSEILDWNGIRHCFSELGQSGWELVNIVSQIGDMNPDKGPSVGKAVDLFMAGPRVNTMTEHKAGTVGYLFAFKREILD